MTSWLWRAVFASFVCLAQMAAQDPVAEAKQKIAAAELRVQRAELERDQAKLAVRTAEGGDARKAAEERLGRLEKELERRSVELESAKLAARAAELDSKEAAAKKPAGPMTLGEALPKAKEGDVDAQYQMGLVFLVPRGVDRDLAQAAAWFAKAAEQGHAEAMARLGKLYAETPLLWPGRKDEGIRLLKLAMEKGSVAAAVDLGYITEDPVEKARLYARAEPRSPRGRLRLGLLTLEGKGVAKDQAEGLRLIELARAGGDPRVQVELGRCYEDGECGLSKNPGAAAKLYAEAAARGSAEGEYRLSWCYSEGRGVAKNQEESLRLLESAAAKWDPQAQWLLGSKLVNGYDDAVAQNVEEGARLLALGAAQGDIAAMSELSGVLLWGGGSMG
ncbi:MAG: sel1 repeat family protein [Acidobacteria bacterium]|nr:sel1 repeat family protein [Acidobacteriota bacterium]